MPTYKTKHYAFALAPTDIGRPDLSNLMFLRRGAGEPLTDKFSSDILFPTHEGDLYNVPAVRENPWTLERIKQMQPSLEATLGFRKLVLIGIIEETHKESGVETQHPAPGVVNVQNISSVFTQFTLEILDTEEKKREFAARVV